MKKFVIFLFILLFFSCEKEEIQLPQLKQPNSSITEPNSKPIKKIIKTKKWRKKKKL